MIENKTTEGAAQDSASSMLIIVGRRYVMKQDHDPSFGKKSALEIAPVRQAQPFNARARIVLRAINADLALDANENSALRTAHQFDFSTIAEPNPGDHFDARLDIAGLTQKFPDQDPDALLMYGAMVSGVRLGDAEAPGWARLAREYSPDLSHFYVTGEFRPGNTHHRRLSLRVVPDHWQNEQLKTPFTVTAANDQLVLAYENKEGDQYTVGEFSHSLPADVPRLAYRREGREHGDNGIVINPIMTCPHRCTFCSRQYDSLNKHVEQDDKTTLAVLSPKEIIDHVSGKWSGTDWDSTQRVSLVTGSFTTFDTMYDYIQELRSELFAASGGKFQTGEDSRQEILVLTHLARTPDQFKALKALGVTVQDTIEVLDNQRRTDVMPRASKRAVPKYHFTQEDILNSVPDAVSILGEGYRATVILGLDEAAVTLNGFKRLREAGLKRLYYPVFQPYGYKDVSLYGMNLDEILQTRKAAGELFSHVY